MRKPHWRNRLHSGKLICVPNAETKEYSNNLVAKIKRKWAPPAYFYHWQRGGHVCAVKLHVGRKYYFHIDLRSFYSHVGETRVYSRLKDLFPSKGRKYARKAAYCSTVPLPGKPTARALPYGFPQSPILASICLQTSILGRSLEELYQSPSYMVSVYMDDIIVSTNSSSCANEAYEGLLEKVTRSNFAINMSKCTGVVAGQIEAFNIIADAGGIKLTEDRLAKFKRALKSPIITIDKLTGVLNYVRSINLKQYEELLQAAH